MKKIGKLIVCWFLLFVIDGITSVQAAHIIYMIGDSTMSNKSDEKYPETGWGQAFALLFNDSVKVDNRALDGRSTKSFIEEGRWTPIYNELQKGDYVIIQFGHNDEKVDTPRGTTISEYKQNLKRFIVETKKKGAVPVLLTPLTRRTFTDKGNIHDSHGDYSNAVREVAKEEKVYFIDAHRISEKIILELGREASKELYLWIAPGQYAYYPEGKQDNTHFTVKGAQVMAEAIVVEMKRLGLPLCKWLKTQIGVGKRKKVPLYLDAKVQVEDRIEDLLKRMTLTEKIAQMCQYVGIQHMKEAEDRRMNSRQLKNSDAWAFYPGYTIKDIEDMVSRGEIGSFLHVLSLKEANRLQRLALQSRLRIPLLIGIDALHGNGMIPGSTVFPSPIGLSCTWDTALVRKTARQTAVEMRATGFHWTFSPNLDIARDARWGRVGETFGEDTHLVTAMGVAMIKGFQGERLGGKHHVIACAKHLVGGSEPINGLNVAPTDISERTLWDIYYPPFKASVDAGVFTVMPAHNEINGIACHANRYLMTELLRDKWGFKGFYISDFKDIERLAEVHRVAANQKEAVYKSIIAGMDMHMHGPQFMEPVLEMIAENKLSEERIDESVRRILEVKFRLGLFEDPFVDEYKASENLFVPEHRTLALAAARKSIVLLKNSGNLLPLKSSVKRILVTGPNANNQAILGDWSAMQPQQNVVTILEGMRKEVNGDVKVDFYDTGSAIPGLSREKIKAAAQAARENDVVIAVIGENALRSESVNRNSGENVDRDNIDPAGLQNELIEELCRTGRPVIVVLVNGRPLSITQIQKQAAAIVEAWEPGSFGGQAVAEILLGKVNPVGKLTVSFPRSVGQIPVFYNHKPSQYVRKYLQTSSEPLYTFGEGLSYTSYAYSTPVLSKTRIHSGETVIISTEVTNTGKREGSEIVQLYIRYPVSDVTRAVKELKGFQTVHLKAGEKKKVSFELTSKELSSYDAQMNLKVDEGDFILMLGGSSCDKDLKTAILTVRKR